MSDVDPNAYLIGYKYAVNNGHGHDDAHAERYGHGLAHADDDSDAGVFARGYADALAVIDSRGDSYANGLAYAVRSRIADGDERLRSLSDAVTDGYIDGRSGRSYSPVDSAKPGGFAYYICYLHGQRQRGSDSAAPSDG